MTVEIRAAQPGDSRRMAEIHVRAWRAAYVDVMDSAFLANLSVAEREKMWLAALSENNRGHYLVGSIDDIDCGFCVYGPSRDEDLADTAGELIALNVDPDYWRNGIGAGLVFESMHSLKTANYETACLWVVQENLRAIRLYERFGFKASNTLKIDTSHSGKPITEVRYTALLN